MLPVWLSKKYFILRLDWKPENLTEVLPFLLPNFKYPGDISSSKRYFNEDITDPVIEAVNGEIKVPETAGLGFEPVDELIQKYTIREAYFK